MRKLTKCPSCGSESIEYLLNESIKCDNDIDWYFMHERESRNFNKEDFKKYLKSYISICEECTLIFRAIRESDEEIDHIYALFQSMESRRYIKKRNNGKWKHPQLRKIFLNNQKIFASDLLEILDTHGLIKNKDISVFHLRTEAGHILNAFAAKGIKSLYGADYFDENIHHGKTEFNLKNLEIMNGNDFSPNSNQKKFDLILANHSFTHAYDPKELFLRLKEMINDDGVIISFNEVDHKKSWKRDTFNAGLNAFHKQLTSQNSIYNAFRLLGFSVNQINHPIGRKYASVHDGMMFILKKDGADAKVDLKNSDLNEMKDLFKNWWHRHYKIKRKMMMINSLGIYRMKGKLMALNYHLSRSLGLR